MPVGFIANPTTEISEPTKLAVLASKLDSLEHVSLIGRQLHDNDQGARFSTKARQLLSVVLALGRGEMRCAKLVYSTVFDNIAQSWIGHTPCSDGV